MAKVQQHIRPGRRAVLAAAAAVALLPSAGAARFYPDDPIQKMPPPLPVAGAYRRKINGIYDFFANSTVAPREKFKPQHPIPGAAVNTLGEVPDSDWYTNRHGRVRMSLDELRRGPERGNAPVLPLTVTSAKSEGVTPGFAVTDARRKKFLVKFDPLSNPEMSTSADVIGSKFFYAFGYNVPENYIVNFRRGDLILGKEAKIAAGGVRRPMTDRDIADLLANVPVSSQGVYRGMASFMIPGELLGPFRYAGARSDDPNDLVPHEHRRDLRGLYVFAAWLQHTDIKASNTLDTLVKEDGIPRIKHYLIDFGAILGSDSDAPKDPKLGHEYFIDFKPGLAQLLTLGLYVPGWARRRVDPPPAAGRFDADVNPDNWKSNYPNPAFLNRLPDDEFWAAKQVMQFTPDEIRAVVQTAQYSNLAASEYIVETLIARQMKIGAAAFRKVLPLDNFLIRDGKLSFADLAVNHNFAMPRIYSVRWHRFDNDTGERVPIAGASGLTLPRGAGRFRMAEISSDAPGKMVRVYLRDEDVVGVERTW